MSLTDESSRKIKRGRGEEMKQKEKKKKKKTPHIIRIKEKKHVKTANPQKLERKAGNSRTDDG